MSEVDNNSLNILMGSTVAAGVIVWAVMRALAARHFKRLDQAEHKIDDLSDRTLIIEQTVVKDKELNRILKEFKKDVDTRFNLVNNNIDATREDMRNEFKSEHKETRESSKEEMAELKKFFTDLYKKQRKEDD